MLSLLFNYDRLSMISVKVDYGLFLLMELAKHSVHETVSLRTIADQNQMSFFFLQKVALELRRAGLVQAGRGKNGGYALTRTAENISLKEVIETLDGPIALMHCLNHGENSQTCVREGWCGMRQGLHSVNQIILNIFAQTTLASLLQSSWKQPV